MFFTEKEKWCEITIFIDDGALFVLNQNKNLFLEGERRAKLYRNYSVEWEFVFRQRNILIYAAFFLAGACIGTFCQNNIRFLLIRFTNDMEMCFCCYNSL